ncbi:MAG: DUF6702 family protein, partial [Bacteroidota bacterium]
MKAIRGLLLLLALGMTISASAHPLRLSLCEIDYSSSQQEITIKLKLFLTDVNEAIVFDPYSTELAFCQPNESAQANQLLLSYLNRFFHIKINGQLVDLDIQRKHLKGEGDNTALWLHFKYPQTAPLNSLEIKNAVFTDLFFDQNNLVYIHVDKKSKSLILDKKKP